MLFMLFIALLSPFTVWAKTRVLGFTQNGVSYYAVLLDNPSSEAPEFRTAVTSAAEDFMIHEYVTRGTLDPVRDKNMIQALKTTETMDDGRSQLLVIFQAKNGHPKTFADLGEVTATLRVAHQTEDNMLLPYEERLAARGLRELPPVKIRENQKVLLPSPLEFGANGELKPVEYREIHAATGAQVEMKNFVIAKTAKPGIAPTMLQLVERAGWIVKSDLKTMSSPRVFNADGLKPLPQPPELPEGKPTYVSDIYLETGVGRLQRYYERFGFETVSTVKDPDVASNGTALMRLSRAKVQELAKKIEQGQRGERQPHFQEIPETLWHFDCGKYYGKL